MAIGDMVLSGLALQLFGPKIRDAALDDFAILYLINNLVSRVSDAAVRTELTRSIGPVLERVAKQVPKAVEDRPRDRAA